MQISCLSQFVLIWLSYTTCYTTHKLVGFLHVCDGYVGMCLLLALIVQSKYPLYLSMDPSGGMLTLAVDDSSLLESELHPDVFIACANATSLVFNGLTMIATAKKMKRIKRGVSSASL